MLSHQHSQNSSKQAACWPLPYRIGIDFKPVLLLFLSCFLGM
jgi:hypothetical protein